MRFITPTLGLLLISVFTSPMHARIGEPQEEFERRLLQPNLGKFVLRDRNQDPARELEQLRQQPFNQVRLFFPDDLRERKYWKSAVPNMLSNDNGWLVITFYQNGVSVMEAYKRVGAPLNDFEVQNILAVNQAESQWRQVDIEAEDTAIGGNFQLADGSCAALQRDNWLVVYSGEFDKQIKKRMRSTEAQRNAARAERQRFQQESAPGSTAGF